MKSSSSDVQDQLTRRRVVPVAVVDSVEDAVPLARALAQGGLPVIEITLRTPCALDCIRAIRQGCPEVLVGAGTILDALQLRAAIEAGARFGVSPGMNPDVVRAAIHQQTLFIPGVMTPSEVETAVGLGCRLLKFFPAEVAGGVKMLKALAGPYEATGVRFIPLGGVSAANLAEYLALPIVAAVGGSWMCERRLVRENKWTELAAIAAAAVAKAAASAEAGKNA
jgi:2-dehydro-3-deoxyphosphogluconate aldolase/(4S)-4-hydroxy-2-oxoglutarate aldolase